MIHGGVFQFFHRLVVSQQRHVFSAGRYRHLRHGFRHLRKFRHDPQIPHIILKIHQLVVDFPVAEFFRRVYIIQFIQDHLEGFCQRIKMYNFLSFGIAAALHPEVRIDQNQGFHRKVLQFQIPGGMVGCNMADHRHVEPVEADVRIIIMEIRDPPFFAFAAAVLTDVMACGRTGNQPQIHRHLQRLQLTGHMHGHIVDAGNVSQRVPRSNLDTDAHELINALISCHPVKPEIFLMITAFLHLCRPEKPHVQRRIKRQGHPFKFI